MKFPVFLADNCKISLQDPRRVLIFLGIEDEVAKFTLSHMEGVFFNDSRPGTIAAMADVMALEEAQRAEVFPQVIADAFCCPARMEVTSDLKETNIILMPVKEETHNDPMRSFILKTGYRYGGAFYQLHEVKIKTTRMSQHDRSGRR